MANYPIPDGTNDMALVLFPPGVTSFNEDYQAIEDYNEREQLWRFNSIVKTPGIVSKKATEASTILDNRNLCPIATGNGNEIKITAGTGFTANGARISIPIDLTVTDITLATGYVDPTSSTSSVFIALRKTIEDGYPRTHPLDGSQHNTRRRIKYDNTIVEFLEYDPLENPQIDPDVVILGQLTAVSSPTFDLTETTGLRKILRLTESATCETSGFTMEGDIDMNNFYDILNVPQWGSAYWSVQGVPNNKDFIRLFGRVNSTILPVSGLRFTTQSGSYGLYTLDTGNTIRFTIIGGMVPMRQVNIGAPSATFKSIPANHVLYYSANEYDMGLSNINVGGVDPGNATDVLTNSFTALQTASVATFNMGATGDTRKIPLCWHYYYNGVRRLIFANGVQLIEGEEIRTDGRVSTFVKREGDTMFGDLTVEKTHAKVFLKNTAATITYPGIYWQDANGSAQSWFYRDSSLSNTTTIGDHILSVYDPSLNTARKYFYFKRDGRLQIQGTPSENNDVLTLGYATGSSGYVKKSGDIMTGTLVIGDVNSGTVPEIDIYGAIKIKKNTDLVNSGTFFVENKAYFDEDVKIGISDSNSANLNMFGNIVVGNTSDATPKYIEANGYIKIGRYTGTGGETTPTGSEFNVFNHENSFSGDGKQLVARSSYGRYHLINKITQVSTPSSTTATNVVLSFLQQPIPFPTINVPQCTSYLVNLKIDIAVYTNAAQLVFNINQINGDSTTTTTFYKVMPSGGTDSVSYSKVLNYGSYTQGETLKVYAHTVNGGATAVIPTGTSLSVTVIN